MILRCYWCEQDADGSWQDTGDTLVEDIDADAASTLLQAGLVYEHDDELLNFTHVQYDQIAGALGWK